MAWNPAWANAIASIESQGSGGYSAVGPQTAKGNRAYGKYQVMDFNIPTWTQKHLGQKLTPEQFLASPEAQDAVFRGEFGASVQKYGNPQDAASVWFTGRPASQGAGRSDILGTTGSEYVNKFNSALGQGMTTPTKGPQMMQQEDQQPRGLLEGFGVQRRDETAGGETAQPFYNRDSFKDTAAILAQGFGRMGVMGMEEIADNIAKQRTENKARNKTIEYLQKSGRDDLADAVANNVLGARDAASMMFAKPKDDSTAAMQNYREYQRILSTQGQEAADQFLAMSKGGPTINLPGQKGVDEFEKLDAKALAEVSKVGMSASRSLAQIDRLESLLSNVGTGAMGVIKSTAGRFGVNTEGLDDIQAAEALINTLVPQQRAPGSGPMSDADLALFKRSLPSLINTPQGNQLILQTMRGVAQYDAMGAEIVQKYRSDPNFTQADAFAALQSRPDPFAQFRSTAGVEPKRQMSREDAAKLLGGG